MAGAGLLGSNGAGKTTVVKILSMLLKADAGTARVNGFDVAARAADVRGSISLTEQFTAVDEIRSGRENLVLVARLRHLKDPGTIADDLLRRFSLTEAGTRRVATYSGGMRRRLDIAMSLIGSLPVIFLDEPTAGLDPQARIEVWQPVKKLAEGGTTVLLTTQYLEEAEQLADQIAILHEGRIIVNGTLAELGVPFRDGSRTEWMREREMERAYADRFANRQAETRKLADLAEDAAAMLDLGRSAWLVSVGRPRTPLPAVVGPIARDAVRTVLETVLRRTSEILPVGNGERFALLRELDSSILNPRTRRASPRWIGRTRGPGRRVGTGRTHP